MVGCGYPTPLQCKTVQAGMGGGPGGQLVTTPSAPTAPCCCPASTLPPDHTSTAVTITGRTATVVDTTPCRIACHRAVTAVTTVAPGRTIPAVTTILNTATAAAGAGVVPRAAACACTAWISPQPARVRAEVRGANIPGVNPICGGLAGRLDVCEEEGGEGGGGGGGVRMLVR